MTTTFILALDQSTQVTGYSIFREGQLFAHGVTAPTGSDAIVRINKLRNWVKDIIDSVNGDIKVYIENIQLQDLGKGNVGVTTFQKLAWVQGALLTLFEEEGIEYEVVSPSSWRHVCGIKGRSRAEQKTAAQAYVKQNYGLAASEDEADAICIGVYAIKNNSNDWS